MAQVLLIHHALGRTLGIAGFADELQRAGHTVHTPDIYDGRTFESLDEGLAFYRGDQHLFADASLPSYDVDAVALLTRRVLEFLGSR
jgi:dienelactone hydrolase